MSFIYNFDVESSPEVRDFRPELVSRRGELVAWGSALLVGGAWLALARSGQGVNPMVPILAVPLFLAALSISLGNWMERNTLLRLDREGVSFQNGLRNVALKWNEIHQVQVVPAQWSRKVRVVGEKGHFSFHTLGEVKVGGELKGRVGFAAGEIILKHILDRSGLREVAHPNAGRQGAGYYYTRE
jgi:hypothetical protein